MAETAVKVVATLVVCVVLLALFHRWFEAVVVATPLILEAAAFLTVTLVVGRPRPDVVRLDGSPVSSSFPSGHTAAAACYAAFAVVVFWHTRNRVARGVAAVAVVLVPALVAVARMYRGMHHLSDVTAGALLGAAAVAVSLWILLRTEEAAVLADPHALPGAADRRAVPPVRLVAHRRG
jgi:undecaprenyl-diphosphatase